MKEKKLDAKEVINLLEFQIEKLTIKIANQEDIDKWMSPLK